jgi:hypothetical protein
MNLCFIQCDMIISKIEEKADRSKHLLLKFIDA